MSYLEGVRVLDLGHYIAGPGTCAVLANLGADVVKVEPPGGEASRHIAKAEIARSFSHSRRSIIVDLKREEGRDILHRLLETSDVVVQNLRPGALERIGLDEATIAAHYPRLVFVTITGYPSTGPSAKRPGYDIAAQAGSGMMWVTGEEGGRPQPVGSAIVDVAATHIAAQAALAALLRRERTGRGDSIEVSLLEVGVALQAQRFGLFGLEGTPPIRNGGCQTAVAPASEVVQTSDGYMVFSAYIPGHWRALCRTLELSDLIEDPRFADAASRVRHRPELLRVLGQRMQKMTSRELVALLGAAGIVAEEVRDYPGVLSSADVIESGIFGTSAGGVPIVGLPYRSASAPRRATAPTADAGSSTVDLLRELGLPADTIVALEASGVVEAVRLSV